MNDDELPPLPRGDRNENPKDIGFFGLLLEDRRTHGSIWEQGFWALAVHRFGNWRMAFPKLLRMPMTLMYFILEKWVQITCGIHLPYTVKVGRRVHIWHFGGLILHARSIGDEVQLRHNTTFGVARTNQNRAIPTIGNRVDIGVGVCVLGNVNVGDDAVLGANAVVVKDVPANSIAVGIPAKIISKKES
jgi:serine O-acetyltransferase